MKTYITTKDIIIPAGTEFSQGAEEISRGVEFGEAWIALSKDVTASFSLPEEDMKELDGLFVEKP